MHIAQFFNTKIENITKVHPKTLIFQEPQDRTSSSKMFPLPCCNRKYEPKNLFQNILFPKR